MIYDYDHLFEPLQANNPFHAVPALPTSPMPPAPPQFSPRTVPPLQNGATSNEYG